jgi:hypothetical protein
MFGLDRKGGTAKVIACKYDTEATTMVGTARYHYVLDITPDDGGAPFRVEAHITLPYTTDIKSPDVGDEARVTFNPKKPDHVKFDLDALLKETAAARQASDDELAALAKQPPGSAPQPGSGPRPLDPELQELMDREEQSRNGGGGVT